MYNSNYGTLGPDLIKWGQLLFRRNPQPNRLKKIVSPQNSNLYAMLFTDNTIYIRDILEQNVRNIATIPHKVKIQNFDFVYNPLRELYYLATLTKKNKVIIRSFALAQGNNQRLKWESTKVPLYNAVNGSLITTGSSSTGYQSAYGSLSSVKVKYSDFVNEGLTPKQIIHALSTIKVSSEQAQDIYGNPTSPSISDEISIYVLEEGSDAITTILTNENHN